MFLGSVTKKKNLILRMGGNITSISQRKDHDNEAREQGLVQPFSVEKTVNNWGFSYYKMVNNGENHQHL